MHSDDPGIAAMLRVGAYRSRMLAEFMEEVVAEMEKLRLSDRKFKLGDRVQKTKGSDWRGRVVGFYATELNPDGYCIESEAHPGSVQIYPAAALKLVNDDVTA